MREITDYQIIKTTDAGQLAAQVRAGIAQGLQPYGELIIMAVAPYIVYTQPMVKYAPQNTANRLNISVGATERARAYAEDAQAPDRPCSMPDENNAEQGRNKE